VHDAGKRAAVLIEKMLMYCRQDVGEKIMDIMPTQALIKEVLEVLNTTLLTDEITIEATLECANDIQIDAFELHQILTDLATNARDAMKEQGGIIHISLRTVSDIKANCVACAGEIAGDFLELSVSDNGTGIEPQIMSRIFDPFFTTKQQGEGTGLGLSTLSGIVHHSNGHILVCSNTTQPNQGTTFKLLFPILKMV
jgi:signal transduction histidine kinase